MCKCILDINKAEKTRDGRTVENLHKFLTPHQVYMLKGIVHEIDGRKLEYIWYLGGSWLGNRMTVANDLVNRRIK